MRAFNRVLSAFLAAVLVVVGVLTILEICRAALSQPPAVVQWPKLLPKLRHNSYHDAGPILVCVGLAVLGLLILLSGVRRGKPYALPAGSTAPGVRAEIHRRSLQRAMQAAVVATDRVDSGAVTLRRRSARIVARANTHSVDGLDADIRQRVERLLSSIALVEPPRLKIKTYPAPAPAAPASAAKSASTPLGVSAGAGAEKPTTPPPTIAAEAHPRPAAERQPPPPEPGATPELTPEFMDQPTARLDDLLSEPEGDERR